MPAETTSAKGLEGVVIAKTVKSKVDGQIGKLQYHGYNINDLAEKASFEEVVYLLWYDALPTQSELDEFKSGLVAERAIQPEVIALLKSMPSGAHPMAVLRTAISALGAFDPNAEETSEDAIRAIGRNLLASMPTIVAAWERIRSGQEPVDPRDDLNHAANFLYMLTGEEPDETAVNAIDTYLILLADHGMNASTFSARVTTSTLSDVYSAITTAMGTLKGPAHGGANQKAMEQFQEIGEQDNVDAWFDEAQAEGRRIMGIGHRVYKTQDPRGKILRQRASDMSDMSGGNKWFEIACLLEKRARSEDFFIERDLYANVDYYSAVILYQAGIPVDQFTCLFTMSRTAGWLAHIIEQWQDNRLIRPRGEYVGPQDVDWTPVEER